MLAAGQIEGGTPQGMGWALLEEVRWKDGRVWNHQLTNYIIPTSRRRAAELDVEIVEIPYSHGPFGAKGVGELPMDGAGARGGGGDRGTRSGCHVPRSRSRPSGCWRR